MQDKNLGQKEELYLLGVGTVEFEMTDKVRAIAAQNSAALEEMMEELTNRVRD